MTLADYIAGWLVLGGVLVPLGWAAVEVRRRLLAGWRGAEARLVEAVVTATLVLCVAELVGTFGALRRAPLVIGGLTVGGTIVLVARRGPAAGGPPSRPPSPVSDRVAVAAAGVAVLGVGAQWLAWTATAFRQGMTGYDALFYHAPMAARFAQTGDVTRLHPIVPGEAVTFYPATTELWHAIGMVAFHSDLASPALNLLALAVALLAAWTVGRRLGGGSAALAGVALVLTVPYAAFTQPGGGFNDAPALALLLASAALLAHASDPPAPLRVGALAGLAAGLAAGIKLSFVAPAALVALGAVLLAPRRRRLVTAGVWAAAMLVSGGYWYARNLVRVGNPLPGAGGIGPLHLPTPALPVDQMYGARLLDSLDLSAHGWRTIYHPGLSAYFGRSWPALLAVVAVAIGGGLVGRRRVVAIAMVLAVFAYMVTPVSGDPVFFGFNIRYTIPVQGLSVLVLATMPGFSSRWAQRGLVAVILAVGALTWPGPPAGHRDLFRVAAWPAGTGHRVAAVALAVALAGLATAGWECWRAAFRAGWPATAGARRLVAAGLLLALVGTVVAGRGVGDRYARRPSYRDAGGELTAAWRWAQGVHDARIGVVGLYQQYPFYGRDLTNYVQYVGVPTPHGGWARASSCRAWREAVNAGRYRYVVTSREGVLPPPGPPTERDWTREAPTARVVLHAGDTDVFELSGPLDPAGC